MQSLEIAIPILVLAAIVALPLRAALRGRSVRPRAVRPPRPPRPRKSTLHSVSRSQMDEELQDLIRRRS
ncbi:MAG TPA: hypothetical protein VN224_16800 [Xanthomonadales bacterium]|nr:hypothetical protein [Xanthomonadales bacterium]